MMVEAGKMRLVETVPGEVSPICVFDSVAGESFSVARLQMGQEEEAETIVALREILKDEGML